MYSPQLEGEAKRKNRFSLIKSPTPIQQCKGLGRIYKAHWSYSVSQRVALQTAPPLAGKL